MEYYFQRQLNARRMRLASRVVGTPGVQNIKWPFLYRQIFVRILTRQQETFLFFIVLLEYTTPFLLTDLPHSEKILSLYEIGLYLRWVKVVGIERLRS